MLWLFNFIATRLSAAAAWRVLTLAVPLAAAVAGALGGWAVGRAPLQAQNAALVASHAQAVASAATANALKLQAAQQLGDALSADLAVAQARIRSLTQEKAHAIRSATSGAACLRGPALGVLHGAPGIRVTGFPDLPAPTGAPAAAIAPAAPAAYPDGLTSTDTAVATWMLEAGAQYEACRAQLGALIAWHAQQPMPNAQQQPTPTPTP